MDWLDQYKKHITLERFFEDGQRLKRDKSDESYLISYPEFIAYFKRVDEIDKHNLIIGINFTYGWMPTAFDFRSEEFDSSLKILNDAKKGKMPDADELSILMHFLNNSLVGTSKLLHFIRPDLFAIWDSRVYRYLTQREANQNIYNFDAFLDYLKFCQYLSNMDDYNNIHSLIEKEVGYEITKFRSIELIMFKNGRKIKT